MFKEFILRANALIILLVLMVISARSQDLFLPRDIQRAFNKGTRSFNGEPGKNYWQNKAHYDISIKAFPPDRNIVGEETIVYTNNSPDTLKTIFTRLYLNIHKAGAARDFGVSPDYLTKGMKVDSLFVNGISQPWDQNRETFTIHPFKLPSPLFPHDSLRINFKWHYEISKESNREGMIDSMTYFLAYFYPRVSVYDDYQGWDITPFVDSKEFYSDFNDYRVRITVPSNYIVWGTGTLTNANQILNSKTLSAFQKSLETDSVLHLAQFNDVIHGKILKPGFHTWEFMANNIPDMTFGISNHLNWDASSVEVDTFTHRRASVQSAYDDKAEDFHHMVDYAKHSLYWFSRVYPGIPYPYEKTTIFQGFADMEYPMMVNDATDSDLEFSRFVVEHEIAHTYMPFYMGINETRYGFMDEGWATTFEYLIGQVDLGKEKADKNYENFRIGYMSDLNAEQQIPIIIPGTALTGEGLGTNEYGKASLGYLAVKSLLGEKVFKECLKGYMARWHGKHPIPWDFFNTFNNISHKNLNWFWNAWFFSPYYNDMGIKSVKGSGLQYIIQLENIGGMPIPMQLIASFKDGSSSTIALDPGIWENKLRLTNYILKTNKKLISLKLETGIFLDGDVSNNVWKP